MSFEVSFLRWFIPATALLLSIAFALDFARRRWTLERIGDPRMIDLMTNSVDRRRRVFRAFLFTLSATLCVAALAQPSVTGAGVVRQRGIDIAVVLDFSKSMLAMDVYPSRIERAKEEVETLLSVLEADRIATVVFAGGAEPFPLTHDHQAARMLYQGLRPGELAPGSDLGQAFKVARCVLRPDVLDDGGCARAGRMAAGGDEDPEGLLAETPEVADRARAIVIFTDGEDTEGRARAEVEAAVRLGIEVYIVGVGTTTGEAIPRLDDRDQPSGWETNPEGGISETRLERAGLRELAEIAGGEGHYFSLGQGRWRDDLLIDSLKDLKKGDLDSRVVRRPRHVFQRYLFPAFLLLIIEACFSERRRKVLQPGRSAS